MPETNNVKTKFNNGDKPLVMAWIGRDEPNRGDSKSAAGLARVCAEMLGGTYVYVDEAMLEECFPITERLKEADAFGNGREQIRLHKEQVKHVLDTYGYPDLAIGTAAEATCTGYKDPLLVNTNDSEVLSTESSCGKVVAHDLTQDELAIKLHEFHERFPDIKVPILAVMMGGGSFCKETADKLLKAAEQYKEITLFLCPSRRTSMAYADLKAYFETKTASKPHIRIMGMGYDDMLAEYNPYKGLLGAADHIAVVGESYSLISEALFVGKTIYTDTAHSAYRKYIRQGHIKPIQDLKAAPLPTMDKEPVDATRKTASKLVKEFTAKAASKAWKEQGCGPISMAVRESFHWLKSLSF
jgi:hypothetical protein